MLNKSSKITLAIIGVILALSAIVLVIINKKQFKSKGFAKINLEQALDKKENIIPVAILGSGPAGLSAGIYASRSGFKTLIIEGSKPGGQLTGTTYVENWPSIKKILGPDLMKDLHEQNKDLGVLFLQDSVKNVDFSKWP